MPACEPLEPSFVRLVREQTERRGIALVLDEVITFRLAPGGMHSLYGIDGDLVALGKMIGGGFPVGAIGGRAAFMDVFDPRRPDAVAHGGTFSANPVTMRAGLAALEAFGLAEVERIERAWRAAARGLVRARLAGERTGLAAADQLAGSDGALVARSTRRVF